MKRTELKRRAGLRRVARGRGADERQLATRFDATVKAAAGWACVLEGHGCDGPLDAHHVTPKQRIKRWCRTNGYDRAATLATLWDPANGLAVCRRHHDQHERAQARIPLRLVPAAAVVFATKLGLEDRLERTYPETDEGGTR